MGVNNNPLLGGDGFITTKVGSLANWARKNSLWPLPFWTFIIASINASGLGGHPPTYTSTGRNSSIP